MSGFSLLAPIGLLGLFGIPLVILFHMRHTTPVVRDVPALRFWRYAMQEVYEHDRFRRPPLSLLLLLQLLVVAAVALALARPAATDALGGLSSRAESQHLILLLDGSTSMAATDTSSGESRYVEARSRALARLADLREGDVATLVLMGTHSITLEATDAAGIRALSDRLSGLPQPGGVVDLNAALELSSNLLLPHRTDRIVLFSDGAVAADRSIASSLGAPVELVQTGNPTTGNVALTEIATRGSSANPGQQQVFVHLENFSDAAVSVDLDIAADGFPAASRTIQLGPNAGQDVQEHLPAGTSNVAASIDFPDALQADNQASLVLAQAGATGRRILLVSDAPSDIQRALAVLPGATLKVVSSSDAADPQITAGYDLVVYDGAPPAGAPPATPILFVNQPEAGLLPTGGLMTVQTPIDVQPQDPLLAGVELGGVTFGQTVVHQLDGTMTPVAWSDAGPLIYRGRVPGTNEPMIVFTFDVSQSNLPQRVAFPILVTNVVGELVPNPLPASVPLGDPLTFRPHAGATTVRVTAPDGSATELAVEGAANDRAQDARGGDTRLQDIVYGDTGLAGLYTVTELDDAGNTISTGKFTVNAGNPRESDLRANPELASTLALATSSGASSSSPSRNDFWPLLALVGLLVLLAEWLLVLSPWRRSSSARTSSRTAA